MNIDFINLKTYLENKEENVFIKGFCYSVIIGVLLILVIIFSCYQKKDLYYEDILFIDNSQLFFKINYQEIDKVLKNNEIIIHDNKYCYRVRNIIFDNNSYNYQVSIILDDNLLIDNGILDYKILIKEESILKYIVRVMKGD